MYTHGELAIECQQTLMRNLVRERFIMIDTLPLINEITYQPSIDVFSNFANELWAIYLDSAKINSVLGRYSIIGIEPFLTLTSKNGSIYLNEQVLHGDPFAILEEQLNKYRFASMQAAMDEACDLDPRDDEQTTATTTRLPFLGGALGYFSYDLCHHIEHLPKPSNDDMEFDDLAIGFYDLVVVFDEIAHKAWIISSGYPEMDVDKRRQKALSRYHDLLARLSATCPIEISDACCQHSDITSNFSKSDYQKTVQRVIDYIYAGDIFQANLSQRFSSTMPENLTPFQLYCRLRKINPAPFAAYLNLPNTVIASASPERFLKLVDGAVESCPIKGTRTRDNDPEKDQAFIQALLSSEKDYAENTMIVDIVRNDMSRVCEDHSVLVPRLCGLESYATVHHLVSTVTGKLQTQANAIDLLKATFPGGSITGAPKIRAMEVIAELEPNFRGPYCGSIGYIGFDGNMDTSIVIRTYAIKNNKVTFQAGGGIVADSIPEMEYEETLSKASALYRALTVAI